MSAVKKYDGSTSLFADDYTGRMKDSIRLYNPFNLRYSDEEIIKMDKELQDYLKSGKSTKSNDDLWHMHYVARGNLHPETRQPLNKLFRWPAFVPTNIPLILGISVLPPTPFNQIFFQSLNQTYNFGNNVVNSSASNKKSTTEMTISYLAAVTSAIVGSAGLRAFLQKKNPTSTLGKGLLMFTPYIGLVFASSVNLAFSRSKELTDGIPINHPATQAQIPELKSKAAARSAFLDSWLVRITIPIPLVLVPMISTSIATKRFSWYKRTLPKLLYDSTVVGATLWGALILFLSGIKPIGNITLGELEPHIRQSFKELPANTPITFSKGM
jgi:Sideroflexins